jgi:hypothetical protein
MQGLINSLRSEIPELVSTSADITRSIGLQFEYLEKLKSNIGDGFGSLSPQRRRKCSNTIKAIENMESKLEVTDRPTDALSNAQVASIDKADGHSACSVGFNSANMIGRGNSVVQDNGDLFSLVNTLFFH